MVHILTKQINFMLNQSFERRDSAKSFHERTNFERKVSIVLIQEGSVFITLLILHCEKPKEKQTVPSAQDTG